jgi:hypothetical protein
MMPLPPSNPEPGRMRNGPRHRKTGKALAWSRAPVMPPARLPTSRPRRRHVVTLAIALGAIAGPVAAGVPVPVDDSARWTTPVRDEGFGSCAPPESLIARQWVPLGSGGGFELYIDPLNVRNVNGAIEVWLLTSFAHRLNRDGELVSGSRIESFHILCSSRSFRHYEEHHFSGPMGSGCYQGGVGSFWGGWALQRRHPPGWTEDIVPRSPPALAADYVCGRQGE